MRNVLSILLFTLLPTFGIAETVKHIGQFSNGDLSNWNEKVFSQHTRYTLTDVGETKVLKAVSDNAASGLFYTTTIDLHKYPYLNWRWKTESRFTPIDETQKAGDDYVLRVYIVIDGGVFFWNTKAINYVWSSQMEKENSWPNAFAGRNAQMIALRNHRDAQNTWYTEKRNIFLDLKRLFGEEIRYIHGVALMTDTDNTHGRAVSYYGDIFFSRQ